MTTSVDYVRRAQERARAAMRTPVSARFSDHRAETEPAEPAEVAPAPQEPEDTPDDTPEDTTVPIGGTVADVLAWVGDDPARAQAAYDAEAARDTPRASLLTALEGKGAQA